MGKHKSYWYTYVRESIRHYSDGELEKTKAGRYAKKAIDKALEDERKRAEEDGRGGNRVKLIECVLIKQTMGFYRAVGDLNISEATAQRWISSFVYETARYMGFK